MVDIDGRAGLYPPPATRGPANACGGTGGVEGPHLLFSDGPAAGSVDFVNIKTPPPISLTTYNAILADDSDDPNTPGSPNRGVTAFRLHTSPDASFTTTNLVS